MTEEEWLACDDPKPMLALLVRRTNKRKLRWFDIACCRRLEELLGEEEIRKVLAAAERYADGLIRDSTARTWYQRARRARYALPPAPGWPRAFSPKESAYHAVALSVVPEPYLGFLSVCREVAQVFADQTGNPRASPAWIAAVRRAEQELVPLLRDIAGNPFRPVAIDPAWLAWHGGTVGKLAQAIYNERALERLPILADALEEAGCTNADNLDHCRQPGEHVPGCWVVDALLGKK
jgi:hypothetical protein